MSFILDALRRAQTVQNHTPSPSGPILADRVPDAPADMRQRAFWLGVGLLTLLIVALLAWWSGRESVTPAQPVATTTAPPSTPAARTLPAPADRAPVRSLNQEVVRAQQRPAPAAAPPKTTGGTVTIAPGATRAPAPAGATTPSPTASSDTLSLPVYQNLLVEGRINLPNLKMDMHVYNRTPAKRFVFINFKKYREGDTLDRTTTIEEITPRGVVMNHSGERFLLGPN